MLEAFFFSILYLYHFFSKPEKNRFFETLKKCLKIFQVQKRASSGHKEYLQE